MHSLLGSCALMHNHPLCADNKQDGPFSPFSPDHVRWMISQYSHVSRSKRSLGWRQWRIMCLEAYKTKQSLCLSFFMDIKKRLLIISEDHLYGLCGKLFWEHYPAGDPLATNLVRLLICCNVILKPFQLSIVSLLCFLKHIASVIHQMTK